MTTALRRRSLLALWLACCCSYALAASQAPVMAENGMVVTAQHLATRVGVDVLKDGLLILATDAPQEYVKAVNGRLTAIGPAKTGPFANTLEIVIAADAGALDGTVLNSGDQPLSNAVVALVPAPNLRNRSDLFRSTTTDAAGQFSLRSIPPGDYKLFAWNYAPPDSWQDAAFLRKYEDDGAPVHIDAKGMRTERLRVVPKR